MFLRIVVLAVLATFAGTALPAYAECVVAKKNFISVVLLDKSEGKPGMLTRESITVHLDGKAPMSFRIGSQKGSPWRIPTECKNEMKKVLTTEEVALVALAIDGK